jgi:hypothetical protein
MSILSSRQRLMILILGHIIGWGLVAVTLWLMVTTIVRIHRDIGLATTRGFLWLLAVLVGNLFGVILYRLFRKQVEYLCESVFGSF